MTDKLPNGLMEVTISAYKPSGKWYASHTLRCRNIDLFSKEFISWLKRNVPARLGPGATYVVQSTEADARTGNFHNQLFRHEQLWTEAENAEMQKKMMQRQYGLRASRDTLERLNRLLLEENNFILPYVINLEFFD